MTRPTDLAERLYRRVDKNGPVPDSRPELGPCWVWTGGVDHGGYGRLYGGVGEAASAGCHRLSYELAFGPVAPGNELDHLCRRPRCVRPSHLEPVTHAENMRRAATAHVLATGVCRRGHPRSVYGYERPGYPQQFSCRACQEIRRLARREARQQGVAA